MKKIKEEHVDCNSVNELADIVSHNTRVLTDRVNELSKKFNTLAFCTTLFGCILFFKTTK